MENYCRQLAQYIDGQKISAIQAERPKRLNIPVDAANDALQGRAIQGLMRRGKSLAVLIADGPPGACALYVHLMLGGRITVSPTFEPAAVTLTLTNGFCIQFHVGLGRVDILTHATLESRWAKLGVEPLSSAYRPELWKQAYQHSRRPIKACLIDQQVVAGIGNVYSDEILYRSGIYPGTPASHLTVQDWDAIGIVVPQVLSQAVAHGGIGSALSQEDQVTGGYRPWLKVHYQDGCPCGSDGTVIKEQIAGRTAYWCPAVQSARP